MKTLARAQLLDRVRTRLKEARVDADLSQAEAAEAVGIAQALISRAETGDRELKAIDLYYLAQLFGRSLDSFFLEEAEAAQPLPEPALPVTPGPPAATDPEPVVPAPNGSRRPRTVPGAPE